MSEGIDFMFGSHFGDKNKFPYNADSQLIVLVKLRKNCSFYAHFFPLCVFVICSFQPSMPQPI
jgi:hypothetical protein